MYRLTLHVVKPGQIKEEIKYFDTIWDAKRFLLSTIETTKCLLISYGLFNRKSSFDITKQIQLPETFLQKFQYTQN